MAEDYSLINKLDKILINTPGTVMNEIAEGLAEPTPRHVDDQSGLDFWYTLGTTLPTGLINNVGPAFNNLAAYPFIGGGQRLSKIAIFVVTGAATGVARFGIYSSRGSDNFYPDQLLLSSDEVSTATSTTRREADVDLVLEKGVVYWAAYHPGLATPTIRALGSTGGSDLLGIDPTATTYWKTLTISRSYSSLPDTFPSDASLSISASALIYAKYRSLI